jgi:hypothetical protein
MQPPGAAAPAAGSDDGLATRKLPAMQPPAATVPATGPDDGLSTRKLPAMQPPAATAPAAGSSDDLPTRTLPALQPPTPEAPATASDDGLATLKMPAARPPATPHADAPTATVKLPTPSHAAPSSTAGAGDGLATLKMPAARPPAAAPLADAPTATLKLPTPTPLEPAGAQPPASTLRLSVPQAGGASSSPSAAPGPFIPSPVPPPASTPASSGRRPPVIFFAAGAGLLLVIGLVWGLSKPPPAPPPEAAPEPARPALQFPPVPAQGRPVQAAEAGAGSGAAPEAPAKPDGAGTEAGQDAKPVPGAAPVRTPRTSRPGSSASSPTASEEGQGPPMGFLTVTSQPPAYVLVDGVRQPQRTPLKRYALPAGQHELVFKTADGRMSGSYVVIVEKGEMVSLPPVIFR